MPRQISGERRASLSAIEHLDILPVAKMVFTLRHLMSVGLQHIFAMFEIHSALRSFAANTGGTPFEDTRRRTTTSVVVSEAYFKEKEMAHPKRFELPKKSA